MKKIVIKCLLICTLCMGMLFCTACSGASEEEIAVIDKLVQMTEVTEEDGMYTFSYDDEMGTTANWKLMYSENNEAVRIENEAVISLISNILGNNAKYPGETTYAYDFSEGEFRIYVDTQLSDGSNVSIVQYNIENDELSMMIDSESFYTFSDEWDKLIRDSGLIDAMVEDLQLFSVTLEEMGLSFDDVAYLYYDSIAAYL